MKKLFLLFVLIPFTSLAQIEDIGTVYGFKFGMSSAEARAELDKRGTFYKIKPDAIIYTDVAIGSRNGFMVQATFYDNKLGHLGILFKPIESQLIDFYNNFSYEINDILGPAEYTLEYTPPYSKNGGKDLEAIKAGKLNAKAEWEDSQGRWIEMSIKADGSVIMTAGDDYIIED